MTEGINAIGAATSGSTARLSAASTPTSSFQTELTGVQDIKRISPVIKLDPIAGVLITQYLGSDGQVQTQIPSAASVAYLRVGLTATGEVPKDSSPSTPQTVLA